MTYQPYLISNYSTGYDRELQPWLLADDAWVELLDGFVYKGVTQKRDGYTGFANGRKSIYTESRMVHEIVDEAYDTGDGTVGPYIHTLSNAPVARGFVTITAGAQTYTDNGNGYFLEASISISSVSLSNPAGITTSVNHGYTTGDQVVLSSIGGTTELNSTIAYTITVTGLTTFTLDGVDATNYTAYTSGGTSEKVAGTIDYTTGDVSLTFSAVVPIATPITVTYSYYPGNPVMGVMNFYPTDNVRQMLTVDTQYVNKYNPSTDRMEFIAAPAVFNGTNQDFFSWVNYETATSAPRLLFCNGVAGDTIQSYDGTTITDYAYTLSGVSKLNARQLFNVRDRLVLFDTWETTVGPVNTRYPRRIRISGTGTNSDVFDTTASGAGIIDIPDNTHFFGAAFNRDDILFYTEAATWMLKYTGNDITPFTLEKIDGSRGSKAAFSVYSYLNQTIAASPRGLIMSNGYAVERMDDKIPFFSFEDISDQYFESCYSGFIDEDRDIYMLFPSDNTKKPALVPENGSDRILVMNMEESNYAIYKIPMSCMGNFEVAYNLLWSDLTAANGIPDWTALGSLYDTWDAFPFQKATPVSIGGGHKGEIWKLNETQGYDNLVKIRNVQDLGNNTFRITTDWNNYNIGDYIYFQNIGGTTDLNHKQAPIINISTDYTTFDVRVPLATFSAYTGDGIAAKTIPFECLTKKFNPFINLDKKLKVGWIYFYVEVAETFLLADDGTQQPALLYIDVIINDESEFSNPAFTYTVDCTNQGTERQTKRWVKIWINQVAKFLQFRIRNNQAGARVKVHAMMPGMMPIGRLV